MRRKLFYLSIALLAFGIGSLVVYGFILRKAEISNKSDFTLNREMLEKVFLSQNENKLINKEYISEKDKALLLFGRTLNNWLSGQKIDTVVESSAETIKTIADSKLNSVDERKLLQSAQKSYKTYLIAVNEDGESELSVLSNCSPPEHCELWIFKKTKEDFEVILNTYTEVEDFKLRESKTEEYFDIETTHSYPKSETSLGMAIYKFDGKQYIKKECYDYIYLYKGENGKLEQLEKPKLIPLHCC